VKRTADRFRINRLRAISRPLCGLTQNRSNLPALKRWAIFMSSASRTNLRSDRNWCQACDIAILKVGSELQINGSAMPMRGRSSTCRRVAL
jgi:hypothetical protein